MLSASQQKACLQIIVIVAQPTEMKNLMFFQLNILNVTKQTFYVIIKMFESQIDYFTRDKWLI